MVCEKQNLDENMAPRGQNSPTDVSGPQTQNSDNLSATSELASTSQAKPNNAAGLMLQKLGQFIRVMAEEKKANPDLASDDQGTSKESENTGPQTRNRGRAEKLKSRWMNALVLSSSENGALPPPPPVRNVKTPDLPPGYTMEFEPIGDNEYLLKVPKADRRMTCECNFTPEMAAEGRLGCSSLTECYNRMLYVECGTRCAAGDYCANKRFQRHEYADMEVFEAGEKGLGIRTRQELEAGDFLLEYVGEVINFDKFRSRLMKYSRAGRKHWFFMALSSEQYVDATRKGNIARYMNHSCDPNAEIQKWTVNGQIRIGFFARRHIEAGEELTLDYQFETYGVKVQTCLCGSGNCRGYIGKLVAPVPDSVSENWLGPLEGVEENDDDDDDDLNLNRENSTRRRLPSASEQKAMELSDKIKKLSGDSSYLRSRTSLLELCRLMVRAESRGHRSSLIDLLSRQVSASSAKGFSIDSFTRDFVQLHGLDVLWSWLVDEEQKSPKSQSQNDSCESLTLHILQLLKTIPIPNRNAVDDSQLWSYVDKLANSSNQNGEVKSVSSALIESWSKLRQIFKIPRMVVTQSSLVRLSRQSHIKSESDHSPMSRRNERDERRTSRVAASGSWPISLAGSKPQLPFRSSHDRNSRSRFNWQNSINTPGSSKVASLSKEERRRLFELEEERLRQQHNAEKNQMNVSGTNSIDSFKSDSDQSPVSDDDVLFDKVISSGLDFNVLLAEVNQLLSDPDMADLITAASNEADSEKVIAKLNSFPSIVQFLSSTVLNDSESTGEISKADESLPSGWASAIDTESGRVYYYNRDTSQTQWEIPTSNSKKRHSMSFSSTGKSSKVRRVEDTNGHGRSRPCEVHNIVDDCSPYLKTPEIKGSGKEKALTDSESSNISCPDGKSLSFEKADRTFKRDLSDYVSKLLKPFCKDTSEECKGALIFSRGDYKSTVRKLTDSIFEKESARAHHHHLKLNNAIQAKVQSFVDTYVEKLRLKQQRRGES